MAYSYCILWKNLVAHNFFVEARAPVLLTADWLCRHNMANLMVMFHMRPHFRTLRQMARVFFL